MTFSLPLPSSLLKLAINNVAKAFFKNVQLIVALRHAENSSFEVFPWTNEIVNQIKAFEMALLVG